MDNHDIITAVQYGDFRAVREYIEHRIYSSNATDQDGCSLLHWAAINNRVQITQYLLEHGANVDYQGGYLMETPLHWAVRKNFYRVMKLLIDSGANLRLKSNLGVDVLHLACQLGNLDTILVLISWDRQQTPPYDGVHLLTSLLDSQTDAIEPIRLLLSINKYNFFSKTENGDNILHIISSKTSREVSSEIIWTIWRQEDAKFAKFEKNREGKTPYQITIQKKDLFMFRFQWDLWMYSVFPRFLPVWITAFACLSPSLFFPIFGWFNGTIITLCVWIISDILGQRTISPQASRTAQGVAWGLLFLITYEYWTHIQLEISSTLFSMLYYLLALGSAVLMLWVSFAEAKRVDPLDRKDLVARIVATAPKESPDHPPGNPISLCSSCIVDKQFAAVHCSTCDACMSPLLDHHCAFLNNCIGEGNRRLFCLFLCVTFLATFVALYAVVSVSFLHCPVELSYNPFQMSLDYHGCLSKKSLLHLEVLLSLSFGICIWLFAIFWGQLLGVACESTIFEITRRRNVREWFTVNRMLSNLNIFILTGYYKVTRAGELDSHSPSTNAASLSRPRPHFSLSSSTHNRQQHSDEAEELLFEGNVSSDALGSSSHHLTRFREGSFDIEMSGTNHLGHGREREGYERY